MLNSIAYGHNHPFGPEFWRCLDAGKFPSLEVDIPRGTAFHIYKAIESPGDPQTLIEVNKGSQVGERRQRGKKTHEDCINESCRY